VSKKPKDIIALNFILATHLYFPPDINRRCDWRSTFTSKYLTDNSILFANPDLQPRFEPCLVQAIQDTLINPTHNHPGMFLSKEEITTIYTPHIEEIIQYASSSNSR
jgi:hypothetical protein